MKKKKKKKRTPKNLKKNNREAKKAVEENRYIYILGLFFIILLGVIIYSNSFDSSFHLDDEHSIVDNVVIRDLSDVKTIWNYSQTRFIPYYSFALNYYFDELNVRSYHLVNLIIHLINASLVFWLTFLILSSPVIRKHPIAKHKVMIAFFTGLMFVSHPLATQSVTYIVQRMASLAALFYLLSMALYVKGRLSKKNNLPKYLIFAGSFISALLAMLSKENAFTLPFAIILFELFFLQKKTLKINFKDYRVILMLAGLLGFTLLVILKFSFGIFEPRLPSYHNDFRTITSFNYLITQFGVIVKYIQLLILPINLNLDYVWPLANHFFEIRSMVSFFILLSLLLLAVYKFKKNRILSFGIFWFLLTLSIESSIIPIDDLIFEHRTYLPSFGFFLFLSWGIFLLLWEKHKIWAMGIFTVIVISNSLFTYQRNKVWKDDFTLWSDVIEKAPDNGRAHYNRGRLYELENQLKLAMTDYNKAIELIPKHFKPYNNRGNIFKISKQYEMALKDYSKAIELNPNYVQALSNRGAVYIEIKKYANAITDLNKAIELNQDFPEAFANRGVAKLFLGSKESSCMDFEKAIQLGFKPVEELYNQNCR